MRLPAKPPHAPKHREERLKLAASGLQALALTLFAAVLIAPALNPSPCRHVLGAGRSYGVHRQRRGLGFHPVALYPVHARPEGAGPMTDLIGNLFLDLALASVGAACTYLAWRYIAGP
jgi:hypothetical protein